MQLWRTRHEELSNTRKDSDLIIHFYQNLSASSISITFTMCWRVSGNQMKIEERYSKETTQSYKIWWISSCVRSILLLLHCSDRFEMRCNFQVAESIRYKRTKICERFIRLQDQLNFALARKRGIVPSSFFVSHSIQQLGDGPIGCGGFADVWKGSMHGTAFVALKLLRPHNKHGKESESILLVSRFSATKD